MIIVKRVLAIIIILAIFVSVVTFFNSIIPTLAEGDEDDKFQAGPPNPDFIEFLEEPPENFYGYTPPSIDLSHLGGVPVQRGQALPTQPPAFDWRDTGMVTPVKDQSPCGTCWIFSTTSVLESAVLIGESAVYDFSEGSVALCVDRSWVYLYDDWDEPCGIISKHGGGNSFKASEVFIKKGAVLETCNPYDGSALQCDGTCICDSCTPVKKATGYRYVTNNGSQTALIKTAVYNNGPVTMIFYYDPSGEYADGTYGAIYDYYPCSTNPNHLASIIGWDDDVPHPDPDHSGTGAWLVKNSWGTADSWAGGATTSDGYFWLAYDSSCMTDIAYLEYKDYDPNEMLYYWDEAGIREDVGASSQTCWMASVFTSAQDGFLTHVDFWTTAEDASYEIYIYNDGNPSNGLTNQLAYQTGSCDQFGYYSIPLTSPVPVSNSQQFTIAVEMTTPGHNDPIPIEYEDTGYCEPPIQTGVCFLSVDGSSWTDASDLDWNVCLRARITSNTPPQVTNVIASQSSPTVDITYDVSDAEQSQVSIGFEYWDSSSWQPCTTTTGEGTQSTGTGKSGTWDAKADFDEHYMTNCKIKVTADDGEDEDNIGTGESSTFTLDTKDPTGYGCISPANGAINVSVNVNLTCFTASDDSPPVSYYFQLAEDGAFSVPLQESGWQSSTTWSPSTIDHNKQYFWRVKAKDSYDNETGYSSTFDFTTQTGGGNPQIEWLHWSGQIIEDYTYVAGTLVMITDYAYFRNTGGPGTVEFDATIVRSSDGSIMSTRHDTFSIVSGQDYRLTLPIAISAWKDEYVFYWYDLSVISPSATSNYTTTWFLQYYISTANINPMILESYVNHPPDAPTSPLCEGETNPTYVNDPTPEFSWTFSDPDSDYSQGAYRILVASTSENLASDIGDMWDSGKVNSHGHEASYNGTALTGNQTYYWKVKTWDSQEAEGPYCAEQYFDTSTLLSEAWVDDDWIGSNYGDPVGGHTFGVDAFATIQEGIDAVIGSTVYVAAGTYYENITMKDGVEVLGAGAGVTTIDGGGSGSVVTARNTGPSTRLDGFTITNGCTYGGGMYNSDSSPIVSNCIFLGNSGGDYGRGGGMYNSDSSPTVTNCIFSGNLVGDDEEGGGMYNDNSSPVLTNCTFSGNSAGEYGEGGGMFNDNSSPVLTNCTFSGNSAGGYGGGGGMYNFDSSPVLTNCIFSGNSAGEYGDGGGMFNDLSSPTLTNCIFSGNSAEYDGGGMCDTYNSSPLLINCTFSGNSAGYRGGGIYDGYSTPTIINNIICNNTAVSNGGGIYASESSSLIIDYNNLWNNSPEDYYGCSAGEHDISENPLFINPSANDYHLQPGSPCIDSGDNTAVPSGLTTDFEGDPRIFDGDGDTVAVVDMGADEYAPPPDIRTPIDHISFGDVYVGNSLDDTTTIYNDSSGYLTINAVTRNSGSAEFSYIGPATPFSIADGQSQAITIRFVPTSEGLKNATFNVNCNDPDSPNVTFNVSGNGMPLPNTPPEVGNVIASQSSPTVDITYDVSDAEQSQVSIGFEYWDGDSWEPCATATGEGTQSTGTGKSGTWNAKEDFDEHYMTDCRIKVTADDGQTENNIGTGESSTFTLDTKDPTSYGCSSPANGAINVSVNVNLTCLTASDDSPPVSYYFQLAEDGAFSVPLQESGWQSSTTWSPSTIDHNKQYFWRVKARDAKNNESEWSSTFTFVTSVSEEVEIQLSLRAGWNMVSVPIVPADNSASTVFPDVAGIFVWNATSRSYYMPTVIDPEKGYWVAVTGNTTITISGTPLDTWTTDIKAGWNMVGSVNATVSIADPDDDPDGSVIPTAYWWDPAGRSYNLTTDIEPGKGYWVASVNDCTLTL